MVPQNYILLYDWAATWRFLATISDKFGVPELLFLWWYYQTIASFNRDGFLRLFSKTLVRPNHLIWNLILFCPDHFTSLTVSMDRSSRFRTTMVYRNHLRVLCLPAHYQWQLRNITHIVFNSHSSCLYPLKTDRTMHGLSINLFKLDVVNKISAETKYVSKTTNAGTTHSRGLGGVKWA